MQEALAACLATLPQKDTVVIVAIVKHCYETMKKLIRDGKHLRELMRRVRNDEVLGEPDEGLGLIAKVDIVALLADFSQEHKDFFMPVMKFFQKQWDEASQKLVQVKEKISRLMAGVEEEEVSCSLPLYFFFISFCLLCTMSF